MTDLSGKTRDWPVRKLLLGAAGLVLAAGLVVAGAGMLERRFLDDLSGRGNAALALYTEMTRSWLNRSQVLAPTYARHPTVVEALRAPEEAERIDRLNRDLEIWNASAGTSVTYVLNMDGVTIASSNWSEADSFIGRDFSFRPYFRQAADGSLGRFFGLGITSGRRGYYFGAPVRDADSRTIGVMVVKTPVTRLEQDLRLSANEVFVSDRSGVVVLAGNPGLRLTVLGELEPQRAAQIAQSRQFDISGLEPAPLRAVPSAGEAALVAGPLDRGGRPEAVFLHLQAEMVAEEWVVHLLLDTAPVRRQLWVAALVAAAVLVAATASGAYLWQRRRRLIERLRERERVERLLEQKVAERTADLRSAISRLRTEVGERKAAEADLRRTQTELVEAGKLAALGQMSAAISHEYNQPLTAIRTYSENAVAFLKNGADDRAAENLGRVLKLTERMGQLSKHLTRFARRSQDTVEPVVLRAALDEALALLDGRIRRAEAEVVVEGDAELSVLGGQVRLQHVFMNLIGNAIDAYAGPDHARIAIGFEQRGGEVVITVSDNGAGFDADVLPKVFDPFFTTKEVGHGLGLGLSISYNIIKDFGGSIRAENRPDGGARFVVVLQAAEVVDVRVAEGDLRDCN